MTHIYSQAGEQDITAIAWNGGDPATASTVLDVNDVPASGSANIDGSTEQGSTYTIEASFNDPAGTPATGFSVAWGDGTTTDVYPVPADNAPGATAGDFGTDDTASGTFSHVFSQPGDFNVTVITSFIRGSYQSGGTVAVSAASPSVWDSGPTAISLADTYTLTAGYYDPANPGGLVVSGWLFNWGDGSTSIDNNASLNDSASHQYTQPGSYQPVATALTTWGGSYSANNGAPVQVDPIPANDPNMALLMVPTSPYVPAGESGEVSNAFSFHQVVVFDGIVFDTSTAPVVGGKADPWWHEVPLANYMNEVFPG